MRLYIGQLYRLVTYEYVGNGNFNHIQILCSDTGTSLPYVLVGVRNKFYNILGAFSKICTLKLGGCFVYLNTSELALVPSPCSEVRD